MDDTTVDEIVRWLDYNPETQEIVFLAPESEEAQGVEQKIWSLANPVTDQIVSSISGSMPTSTTVTDQQSTPSTGNVSQSNVSQSNSSASSKVEKKRDVEVSSINDVISFIESQQKPNTVRSRNRDLNNLYRWLDERNEKRELFNIPPLELDELLSQFIYSVRKQDGEEYEPGSLEQMLYSFQSFLDANRYGASIFKGNDFYLTRKTLDAKKVDLFKHGKGRKPNASNPISDEEEKQMWESGALGSSTPEILNFTMWFIITKVMGFRPRHEHRQLQWQDLEVKTDPLNGKEYLELIIERGSKSRDGTDLVHDPRAVIPRVWATGHPERCPVLIYRKFTQRRPDSTKTDEAPFYLTPKWGKSLQKSDIWFWPRPLGKNKISKMMANATAMSNIEDKKPHGVRKSMIRAMSKAKIPRHQICQISGHKNELSIASYDKMDKEDHEQISKILTKNMMPETSAALPLTNDAPLPQSAVIPVPPPKNPPPAETATSLTHVTQESRSVGLSGFQGMQGLFHGSTFHGCTFNITPGEVTKQSETKTKSQVRKRKRILPLFESDEEAENGPDSDFESGPGVQF